MASTYLQRTPSTTGNRKKWTWSAWIKRSKLGASQYLLSSYESSSTETTILFNSSDQLDVFNWYGNAYNGRKTTNMKFRDTHGFYHIVINLDLDHATADDRFQIYVNGERITSFATSSNPTTGSSTVYNLINIPMRLGAYASAGNGMYFDGIMAHVHFVDGLQLDADTFGSTDSTTGIWKPKTNPTISDYGTNGFFLDFASSSTMGNDVSGKNNDLAVSTGTMTQTIDTPSNVFATFNRNIPQTGAISGRHTSVSLSLTNGNLSAGAGAAIFADQVSTLGFTKGKYYAEFLTTGDTYTAMGIVNEKFDDNSLGDYIGSDTETGVNNIGYQSVDGAVKKNNVSQYTGSTFTSANDIISIAVDMDNNYIYFAKNGVWQNSGDPTSGATGTGGVSITPDEYFFAVSPHNNSGSGTQYIHANFGNGYFGTTAVASAGTNSGIGTFEYDVPSGYKALCTKNINEQEYS